MRRWIVGNLLVKHTRHNNLVICQRQFTCGTDLISKSMVALVRHGAGATLVPAPVDADLARGLHTRCQAKSSVALAKKVGYLARRAAALFISARSNDHQPFPFTVLWITWRRPAWAAMACANRR